MHQAQLRVLSMGLHLCHSPGAKNLVFGKFVHLCFNGFYVNHSQYPTLLLWLCHFWAGT